MILTLLVVTVLAGVALAGVNGVTAPIVAEMEARALQEGLAEVLPRAAIFEEVPADELARAGGPVQAAWRVDAAGERGRARAAAPGRLRRCDRAAGGRRARGTVHQLKVLERDPRDPGLGSKATEPAFLQQFLGLVVCVVAGPVEHW